MTHSNGTIRFESDKAIFRFIPCLKHISRDSQKVSLDLGTSPDFSNKVWKLPIY